MTYPDTYYSRTATDGVERPTLTGVLRFDVVIVGGGLAGLTTALQLSRAGCSVAVLEAKSVGYGASGRNGGFVTPGFAKGIEKVRRVVGREAAKALFSLSVEGAEFVRTTLGELKIESADATSGMLSVLRYDDDAEMKAHAQRMTDEYDYELEYLATERVRSLLVSSRYYHGLRDAKAFHIHPLNYLRALAAEVERLGGIVFEQSPALATELAGTEKIVRTAVGEVRASHIVFATGGYTGPLVGKLQRAYLPIATYVMLSEEAPELIREAISTTDAIADNRRAGDYYRLVDGGKRVLWGGRITTRPTSPGRIVAELRREMTGTFPQLARLKTELAWSGLMSYARHQMPQVGHLGQNVWYCTAFGGHGLNTTAIGGKVIAEGILGGSDRYRLFEPFGLDWAGGAAGLLVAQLTYWKMQAQDWLRERTAREARGVGT